MKTNYDSESFGYPITLENALGFSCDTFFYAPAAERVLPRPSADRRWARPTEYYSTWPALWRRHQAGRRPAADGSRPPARTPTGAAGWRAGRPTRPTWCAEAEERLPRCQRPDPAGISDSARVEDCTDGWRYRAGDNADWRTVRAIRRFRPCSWRRVLRARERWESVATHARLGHVDGSDKVVKTIEPTRAYAVAGQPVPEEYIANSLSFQPGWAVSGAFA